MPEETDGGGDEEEQEGVLLMKYKGRQSRGHEYTRRDMKVQVLKYVYVCVQECSL